MLRGIIVKKSLEDLSVLDRMRVVSTSRLEDWNLVTVEVDGHEINEIKNTIRAGTWYAHFWVGDNVIAVFRNKEFRFKHSDKNSWKPVLAYGLSLGIPENQLDFPIR